MSHKNNLSGGTFVKKNLILLLAIMVFLTLADCSKEEAPMAVEQPVPEKPADTQSAAGGFSGTVVETMKADRYTYVQVDTGAERIWAATPEFRGKKGDTVIVPEALAMQNFHSKTLERDFGLIYFVGAITATGEGSRHVQEARTPSMHPSMGGKGSKSQRHPDERPFPKVPTIEKGEDKNPPHRSVDHHQRECPQKGLPRVLVSSPVQIPNRDSWVQEADGSGDVEKGRTNTETVTTVNSTHQDEHNHQEDHTGHQPPGQPATAGPDETVGVADQYRARPGDR